jgi:hypothetical protein
LEKVSFAGGLRKGGNFQIPILPPEVFTGIYRNKQKPVDKEAALNLLSLFITEIVSLTDLFATFCDLTGQPPKAGQAEDIFSFWHILNGEIGKIKYTCKNI